METVVVIRCRRKYTHVYCTRILNTARTWYPILATDDTFLALEDTFSYLRTYPWDWMGRWLLLSARDSVMLIVSSSVRVLPCQRLSNEQEMTDQDRIKILHFSLFLLEVLNIVSQLSCKAMLEISSRNIEKCRRESKKGPTLVLS